jgi:3,4-dihydroxy 2-butanone 4-phosphate synthase / GTP cyclohydrolase II
VTKASKPVTPNAGTKATKPLALDSIEAAIADIAAGKPVVVVDDEDRENEGDIIMAAAKATPEWIAFTIRHTSGILCVPLPLSEARRLNLSPMVADNDAPLSTAFTVSVDVREGLTTGISAEERTNTIRALANHNAAPRDFVRPGHIFPLVAREGGVLMRTGHTEAAVDLARLAGLPPVGMLAEIVNDDGSVKKGPQIEAFAREHGLKLVSIDDLIAYRQQREKLITRVSTSSALTVAGAAEVIVYSTPFDTAHHVAVVVGDVSKAQAGGILVRLHREDTVGDVFTGPGSTMARTLERIRKEGRGVVIYLREGAVGVASAGRTEGGGDGAGSSMSRREQWREIGLGAQILKDLGVRSIRVLSSKDRQFKGLAGFGVEIVGTQKLEG